MHAAEYDRMAAVEDQHWWYRGLRDLIARLLRQRMGMIPAGARVLDAGCGTGANLQLLKTELSPAALSGFDLSEQAVEYARQKVPAANVFVSDLCRPEVDESPLDLVLCVDVVYMTGLDAALPGLQTLVSRIPTGGWLFLHVPAYQWLYSRHDVAVGTRQRFTRREIARLLDQLGLTHDLLTYRICLLFPLVVLSRLPSLLFGAKSNADSKPASDLDLPPNWLNRLLEGVVRLENRLIAAGFRFPYGSSLIAVGRKP
jgi:SAM-dependent methyltransferase